MWTRRTLQEQLILTASPGDRSSTASRPPPGNKHLRFGAASVEFIVTAGLCPKIKDTVERVNTDAPVNLLVDPIRDRLKADADVALLALALAAWMRRVRGEDEEGQPINVVHPAASLLRARDRRWYGSTAAACHRRAVRRHDRKPTIRQHARAMAWFAIRHRCEGTLARARRDLDF
jgi:hypothetical protein